MRDGKVAQGREYALSEVVGFVLLLGVLIAAMALWMMYVVPVNGRESEIIQMNAIKDRFTDYKISLDSLWINSPYATDYSRNGILVSTSMNLGTGGGNTQAGGLFLPLLNPVASSAVLSVADNGDTMTINATGPNGDLILPPYKMSRLQYQSQNYYWIQQTYYYQDGGVFLTQENGSTCRVSPPVSFGNNGGTTNSVYITPIQLYGSGSMGGNGPVRVDTRLKPVQSPITGSYASVNLSVNVADYNTAMMWRDVFNTARSTGNITVSNWYTLGSSNPGPGRATAFILINGPVYGGGSASTADVNLELFPTEYDVSLNSIASSIS
jgi:hypothetical protein